MADKVGTAGQGDPWRQRALSTRGEKKEERRERGQGKEEKTRLGRGGQAGASWRSLQSICMSNQRPPPPPSLSAVFTH